jgi:hypothetical protein
MGKAFVLPKHVCLPGTFELRFDANHARIVLNLEKWLRSHRA